MHDSLPQICDSHCHLGNPTIPGGFALALKNAQAVGVSRICVVESLPHNWQQTLDKCELQHELLPACGIHPLFMPTNPDTYLDVLNGLAHRLKAIGEIGLDGNEGRMAMQEHCFRQQLRIAKEHSLPVLLHCRRAFEALYDIIKETGLPERGAVLHCYSGSAEQAAPFIRLGCFFSFSGVVTFPNAKKIHRALQAVPRQSRLVETDSPDLAPHPKRGTPNEPANLPCIVQAAADSLNMSYAQFAGETFENSRRFFSF